MPKLRVSAGLSCHLEALGKSIPKLILVAILVCVCQTDVPIPLLA